MSISQTTPEETVAGQRFCPQCHATLPRRATFCSSCGERLEKKKPSIVPEAEDITLFYRITTLVRRQPYSNLYFALDKRPSVPANQSRMVAIRDVEIANLKKETRAEIIALTQQEYDRLRRLSIPALLSSIDLRISQGHLFLISAMPFLPEMVNGEDGKSRNRLYTLQDFLQSGQGLPKESQALIWMHKLGQAVEELHQQGIVLGDLDPYTIVLDKNSVEADPRLMVFWLLPEIRRLLPPPPGGPRYSYFCAPEALQGRVGISSDIYSLGALLYLLLTGTPPDESTLRNRRRLRGPREINARISPHVDRCVMQALAFEPDERFASVGALLEALDDINFRRTVHKPARPQPVAQPPSLVAISEAETVRIVPLSQKDVMRWQAAHREEQAKERGVLPVMDVFPRPASTPLPTLPLPVVPEPRVGVSSDALPVTPLPGDEPPVQQPAQVLNEGDTPPPVPGVAKSDWRGRITGFLPNLKVAEHEKTQPPAVTKKGTRARKVKPAPALPASESDASLLRQFQRLIMGKQQHAVDAAAIIETPLRIRPDQAYNLRMHLMGRDEPATPPIQAQGAVSGGLSAFVHGSTVQVEVRSVLQQGYTYVLQRAVVTIPASGYAAEVTIPMQPQTGGAASRRDRLHVFFLDELHNPLYEKPFVIEVFISPLVQFGREGHQVLTIPL